MRDTGGDGPVLLLVHGWMFASDLNWGRHYAPLARAGYRVLAMDLRGHGRGLRSSQPFRLQDCADDAAALLDVLGVRSALVAGYSMGGPVAQLLARRHPERVAGLVLCATALDWQDPRQRAVWRTMGGLRVLLGAFPLGRLAGGRAGAGRRRAAQQLGRRRAVAQQRARPRRGRPRARAASTARPGWASCAQPAAVVLTARDRAVPPRQAARLAAGARRRAARPRRRPRRLLHGAAAFVDDAARGAGGRPGPRRRLSVTPVSPARRRRAPPRRPHRPAPGSPAARPRPLHAPRHGPAEQPRRRRARPGSRPARRRRHRGQAQRGHGHQVDARGSTPAASPAAARPTSPRSSPHSTTGGPPTPASTLRGGPGHGRATSMPTCPPAARQRTPRASSSVAPSDDRARRAGRRAARAGPGRPARAAGVASTLGSSRSSARRRSTSARSCTSSTALRARDSTTARRTPSYGPSSATSSGPHTSAKPEPGHRLRQRAEQHRREDGGGQHGVTPGPRHGTASAALRCASTSSRTSQPRRWSPTRPHACSSE